MASSRQERQFREELRNSSEDEPERPGRFVRLRPSTPTTGSSTASANDDSEQDGKDSSSSTEREMVHRTKRRKKHRQKPTDALRSVKLEKFERGTTPSDTRNKWLLYKERFLFTLSLSTVLKSQEKKYQFLMITGGEQLQLAMASTAPVEVEILTEPIPKFDNAIKRLDSHFTTGANSIADCVAFKGMKQRPGEAFMEFVYRLQQAAQHCEFGNNIDQQIMLQLETGAICGKKLGKMMIREKKTLNDVINYGAALETETSVGTVTKRNRESYEEPAMEEVAFANDKRKAPEWNRKRPFNSQGRFNSYKQGGARGHFSHPQDNGGGGYRSTRGSFNGNARGSFNGNAGPRNNNGDWNKPPSRQQQRNNGCYECGRQGHFARDCFKNRRSVNNVDGAAKPEHSDHEVSSKWFD